MDLSYSSKYADCYTWHHTFFVRELQFEFNLRAVICLSWELPFKIRHINT